MSDGINDEKNTLMRTLRFSEFQNAEEWNEKPLEKIDQANIAATGNIKIS